MWDKSASAFKILEHNNKEKQFKLFFLKTFIIQA